MSGVNFREEENNETKNICFSYDADGVSFYSFDNSK